MDIIYKIAVYAALSALSLAGVSRAEQFMLVDQICEYPSPGTHGGGAAFQGWYAHPDAPLNWETPVDYKNGKVYVRYEVVNKEEPGSWSVYAAMQSTAHRGVDHVLYPRFSNIEKGKVYTASADLQSLGIHGGPPWPWHDVMNVGFVECSGGGGIYRHEWQDGTRPTYDSMKFIRLRTTIYIVSAGGTFSAPAGWSVFAGLHPLPQPTLCPLTTGNNYSDTLRIKMYPGTPGADIYYTLDGSDPTTSSAKYTNTFLLQKNTVVKSMAVLSGWDPSEVKSAYYQVAPDTIAPRVASAAALEGSNTIEVLFSEPVHQAEAEKPESYTISGGVTVTGAQQLPNRKTVRLTTSTLAPDVEYALTAGPVVDRSYLRQAVAAGITFRYKPGLFDTFGSGDALTWAPKTAGRWEKTTDQGDGAYYLNTFDYSSDRGKPGEYCLLEDKEVREFDLQVLGRIGGDAAGENWGVIFGFIDQDNYSYTTVSKSSAYCNVYIVEAGVRKLVHALGNAMITDADYNALRLRVHGNTVSVYYNGELMASIPDRTAVTGKVGLCSLNRSVYFDDFRLRELEPAGINDTRYRKINKGQLTISRLFTLQGQPISPGKKMPTGIYLMCRDGHLTRVLRMGDR